MIRRAFLLGAFLGWTFTLPAWAQQPPVPQSDPQVRQQKSIYYTQIEYQRCRSDVVELLEKSDGTEKRVKDLEEEVRKLTDELMTVRAKVGEKAPAN